MLSVPHWSEPRTVTLAESRTGTRVAVDLRDNFVYPRDAPWPPPALTTKLRPARIAGATAEDDRAARQGLGYYCALQSLNSEDALTWSVFGTVQTLPAAAQAQVVGRLFEHLALSVPAGAPAFLFWRRVRHPQTGVVSHGPEIDVQIHVGDTRVLCEAKWKSGVDLYQGPGGDRDQMALRADYCAGFGPCECPAVRRWIVLGIGRTADAFPRVVAQGPVVSVHAITWEGLRGCLPPLHCEELGAHMNWRDRYAAAR